MEVKKGSIDVKPADGNNQDVANLIEGILQQTHDRFQAMSDQILRRIDEMAKRVDDLEKNISDLMAEAGVSAET